MATENLQIIERQLWTLFPEVYRNRDTGDLEKFLSSCSGLLEQIYATLQIRHQDAFPDSCQTWLLPYFAQLLDVRLVSPEINGQRKEVANGVAWRQRKGTADSVERIAQDVGQMEVELQEGWQRVATTRRLNMPLLPVDALGQKKTPDMSNPLEAIKHPGLENVFIDFRRASRARETTEETAITHETRFGADTILWHQVNPGGVPCFVGHYEDVSKRTVDLRDAGWQMGHYHPKRVLLYFPPPAGFFPSDQEEIDWKDRLVSGNKDLYQKIGEPEESTKYDENGEPIKLTRRVFHLKAKADQFEEVELEEEHPGGKMRITRIFKGLEPESPLKIKGAVKFLTDPGPDQEDIYRFENIYLEDALTVSHGRLEIDRVAALRAEVQNTDKSRPVFSAKDSLIQQIRVADGLCQLEYCTVLGTMVIEKFQASDCILLKRFEKDLTSTPLSQVVCIRYSGVAEGLSSIPGAFKCTEALPMFYSKTLGEQGCGVLQPSTPPQICFGSEDGSEMGAFHHRHYCLRSIAVTDKLEDFLPVGIQPVIIPDQRLWVAPP